MFEVKGCHANLFGGFVFIYFIYKITRLCIAV